MSSYKNASKSNQKVHRERHQPQARKHLGFLEKKVDYKKRADDFNEKKAKLQYLQKRALDRNPDEFYYHMVNAEVDDGVHKDKAKAATLTPEQIHLMQTQDYRYIEYKRNIEAKKIKKLEANIKGSEVEIRKRKEREGKLRVLQRKMEIKRVLRDKKKVIKDRLAPETPDSAPVYVWKQIRKR